MCSYFGIGHVSKIGHSPRRPWKIASFDEAIQLFHISDVMPIHAGIQLDNLMPTINANDHNDSNESECTILRYIQQQMRCDWIVYHEGANQTKRKENCK